MHRVDGTWLCRARLKLGPPKFAYKTCSPGHSDDIKGCCRRNGRPLLSRAISHPGVLGVQVLFFQPSHRHFVENTAWADLGIELRKCVQIARLFTIIS
jgi:hypothetical protein